MLTSTNLTLIPMVEDRNSTAANLPAASQRVQIGLQRHRSRSAVACEGGPRGPFFILTRPESPSLTASGLNQKPTMSEHAAPD